MTSAISWWRHQMETFSALLALCAGILWSPVNSPQKGQWSGALMFSLICTWINSWVNNREAGDLRHHRAHYDIIVMFFVQTPRKWGVFQTWVRAWYTLWSGVDGNLPTVLAHLQARCWTKGKAFLNLSYLEFSYVFYWSYWNQCSRMCAYHFTLPFFIMTPCYGDTFRIICPLCVNPSVTGGFPRPIRWTFDVFFVVKLNKLFNKEKVELPVVSDTMAPRMALMWRHYKQKLMSMRLCLF